MKVSDLISRSEAEKLGATCLARRNENGQLEAIISLDNAPTVELFCSYLSDGEVRQPCVEAPCKHEIPTGKWIKFDDGSVACPVCGTGTSIKSIPSVVFFRYCPYCGADMRGEEE